MLDRQFLQHTTTKINNFSSSHSTNIILWNTTTFDLSEYISKFLLSTTELIPVVFNSTRCHLLSFQHHYFTLPALYVLFKILMLRCITWGNITVKSAVKFHAVLSTASMPPTTVNSKMRPRQISYYRYYYYFFYSKLLLHSTQVTVLFNFLVVGCKDLLPYPCLQYFINILDQNF